MMKQAAKKFYWTFLFISAFLAAGAGFFSGQLSIDQAYAQSTTATESKSSITDPTKVLKGFSQPFTGAANREPRDPRLIMFGVVQVGLGAISTVFLVLTVYAGYLWWSAGGNETQVENAKKTLRNAVIGLFLVSSSYAIVTFIFKESYLEQQKFGISGVIDDQEIEVTQPIDEFR